MAKRPEENNSLQELKVALRAKKIERLYFFHGEEVFLLQHYLSQIKKLLIDELTESFNYHKFTTETFDIQSFADAVENLPMMAEYTMVQVDEIDLFKCNEADRQKIIEILSDIPDYCTVVFTYETTQWNPDKRIKKLWDAISTYGMIIEFPKQELRDLIAWVTRHFASRNKQISSELCSYLIDITGGTMTVLSGEIGKICAYSGSDIIRRSDIDAVTEPVLDAAVFDMTNLIGQGSYADAFEKLQKLLKLQNEPIPILGAIGVQLRRISTARTLLDKGKTAADFVMICGGSDYAARKTMEAARKFRPEFCAKAAEIVVQTDYGMKTSFDDPERLLEMLVLRLAQEARNGQNP